MVTMVTRVVDRGVGDALDNLIALLSGPGLAAFLGVNMGPYLAKRAGERFASEGDDVTGKWAALHPATIAIRESEGFGAGPINNRTGELENWVVRGGWDAYPAGMGASMTFPGKEPSGRLRDKVQTAQKGRVRPPITEPRPVLGVNEKDMLFFQTSLAFAIDQALK